MWWAIGVSIVMLAATVFFALLLRSESGARKEADEKVRNLEKQVAWLRSALQQHAGARPTLDELDRMLAEGADPDAAA